MRPLLSVLDLSPISSGKSAHETLWSTVSLAEHAESLGYTRYWVAEHHNAASVASSAPEIMIGQIAARTKRIVNLMRENGVLISRIGRDDNILKMRPPLTFQREHADLLIETLDEVLAQVGRG